MEIGSLLLEQRTQMRAWEEVCQEGWAVLLDPCFHTLSSGIESMLNQAAVLGALGKNSMTTLP